MKTANLFRKEKIAVTVKADNAIGKKSLIGSAWVAFGIETDAVTLKKLNKKAGYYINEDKPVFIHKVNSNYSVYLLQNGIYSLVDSCNELESAKMSALFFGLNGGVIEFVDNAKNIQRDANFNTGIVFNTEKFTFGVAA